MSQMNLKKDILNIELDTTELNAAQKRLLKKINMLLLHTMTTDEESDYFNSSSELLKMVACSIKDANFSKFWSENSDIPYADQALEFGVDNISEDLSNANIMHFDN